jgi:hypothetical protein
MNHIKRSAVACQLTEGEVHTNGHHGAKGAAAEHAEGW